jgi:hypothetical protein
MSVVVVQKDKEGFLRMFRQYLTFFNNTGIPQGLKTSMYFVSPNKRKQEKRKKALREIIVNNKKNKSKSLTKKKTSISIKKIV